jgi:hypothetical protein
MYGRAGHGAVIDDDARIIIFGGYAVSVLLIYRKLVIRTTSLL